MTAGWHLAQKKKNCISLTAESKESKMRNITNEITNRCNQNIYNCRINIRRYIYMQFNLAVQ